eukprot:scaffold3466_cov80-Attheya_sp.AAC.3
MMLVTTGDEHAVHVVGLESVAEEHANVHHSKETPAVTADTMDTMDTTTIVDTRNTGAGRRDPDGDVAMANAWCHTNGDYSAAVVPSFGSVALRSGRGDSF